MNTYYGSSMIGPALYDVGYSPPTPKCERCGGPHDVRVHDVIAIYHTPSYKPERVVTALLPDGRTLEA